MARICLVTPGYLSSTPRVVREADALDAAGFSVRVAFTQGPLEEVRAFDDAIVASRRWRAAACGWSNVRSGERARYVQSGVRHRLARRLRDAGLSSAWIADRAEGRIFPELAKLASHEPADLYIGHYPTGLAAAHAAAERHGAQLGYDIEDLYAETFPPSVEWNPIRDRILDLERRYVPECAHLTAVSQPVAVAFAEQYAAPLPIVVHNCHPWSERARIDVRRCDRRGSALSLFWFSQTVGLDRGLQDAIRAAGLVTHPIQIHLRGHVSDDVRRDLQELARASSLGDRLYFHARCAQDEILSRAAEHDVGLALEQGHSLNNRLTASNKIFTYLTAGLALVATDVPGQRTVLDAAPGAGVLYPCGDISALAAKLETWATDRQALAAARAAALDAARIRWNAEREAQSLVTAVEHVLDRHKAQVARGA